MSSTPVYAILMILISGGITFGLRALPFLAFGGKSKLPPLVAELAATLPAAIMAVLVVYCLRGMPGAASGENLAMLAACAVVIGLHLWRKNTLLSVCAGTAVYMMLLTMF